METAANPILKTTSYKKSGQPEACVPCKPPVEVVNVPCSLRSHRPIFFASRSRSADPADGGKEARLKFRPTGMVPTKKMQAALLFNRRLWTIFMGAAESDENPQPLEVRQNIINIAVFVMARTIEMQTNPNPEKTAIADRHQLQYCSGPFGQALIVSSR